jgi:hypothetical protein
MGRLHVSPGTPVTYEYCPPASGTHFQVGPRAPLPRAFYEPNAGVVPGNWIHNLEHGWVVVAYRNDPNDPANRPSAEELAAMRRVFEEAPASTMAGSCPTVPNKIIFVPLAPDAMPARFAYLAWDRVMFSDTFVEDEALTFYQQWVDSLQSPERGAC